MLLEEKWLHGTSTRNEAEKRKMVEDFGPRYPLFAVTLAAMGS